MEGAEEKRRTNDETTREQPYHPVGFQLRDSQFVVWERDYARLNFDPRHTRLAVEMAEGRRIFMSLQDTRPLLSPLGGSTRIRVGDARGAGDHLAVRRVALQSPHDLRLRPSVRPPAFVCLPPSLFLPPSLSQEVFGGRRAHCVRDGRDVVWAYLALCKVLGVEEILYLPAQQLVACKQVTACTWG